MTAELAEHFRNAELEIEKVAEAYEIEKYGVDLLDIDGRRGELFMA